jgi:glycosyltransferase involved in cell wall biosynthesis
VTREVAREGSAPKLLRTLDRLLAPAAARVVANRYGMAAARVAAALWLPLTRKGHVSVVIVNWNTLSYLRETLASLQRFTDRPIEVIVVDNGSTDGSVGFLQAAPGLRSVCLRRNVGHAAAMDLGFLVAGSEIVLSLDVDAFPIKKSWLETIVSPLRAGYTVSGVQLWRPYAHPCCMAIRKSRFLSRRHTFRARYSHDREKLGVTAWDVGESISMRESRTGGAVNLVPVTSQRGPGDVGTVFGECVYHNFYAARHNRRPGELIDGVSADDAARAWEEAVRLYVRG